MKSNLVLSVLVSAYVAAAKAGSGSCLGLDKLATFAKFTEAKTACLTKLNLTSSDIPSGKDLKEKHFNDSCLSSCALESLSLYKNGTIFKDPILEALKAEVATENHEKLTKTVEKCIESAEKKWAKKDKDDKKGKDGKEGDKKNKKMTKDAKPHEHVNCGCRKAAKFVYCMLEKDNKDC